MKRIFLMAAGLTLLASLAVGATSEPVQNRKGLTNSKKVMQSLREREAKAQETRKKGHAMRHLAQSAK